MKLISYKNLDGYDFYFKFENQKSGKANIQNLISKYVSEEELSTAHLNEEWGCLEFKNGMVDIEPKTLYKYFTEAHSTTLPKRH
jgi:uncharacterized membrane protein